ncbi:glycoside hydrolase family 3 N-terminal domain-containing protein [Desulfatitalea alkaliphila]|uniref:beta-N-acetylhexosaminidase n=1 Tax=Desulfatitalea alkaliphila TaxID=2929485 RepID=A0AA41R6Z7_9BACT|nr:glycoside hydrolase family 3 N-terminal domain-containing protein [Desulfatitalea alkaliphila]MCJ8502375.1 beta-N-acetylhexosaminidase [Desulfatitalea alkaliphila]
MRLTPSAADPLTGQRLMVGFTGTVLNDELKSAIDTLRVGGLILFSQNIESPAQVQDLCGTAQAYAADCGLAPLFVAIDQEGGMVARLKPPFTQFAGNPAMTSEADARRFGRITARELRQIGVNMNMAPVLDVAPPDGPSVMAGRVFGNDPGWVTCMGLAVIEQLQADGILAVGKHFPGIGRTTLDSHQELPDLDIDPEVLSDSDLAPFRAATQAGVAGIMLSHIRYPRLDPRWPASLSSVVARDLLRGTLGYQGLVITDDLDMGAVIKHFPLPDMVDQCLAAEVDILLICHTGPNIAEAHRSIEEGIRRSETAAQAHEASLQRIAAAKARYSVSTR